MDAIRRWFRPPVAAAMIALIVAIQLAAILGFSASYAQRGRRIEDLEAALCREGLAQFSRVASSVECQGAQRALAQVLPQSWVSTTLIASGAGARVIGWRPPRESPRRP